MQQSSVTLEGIDNVEDFIEKLDRIEPPGQMVSFLTDPLLQKYVELSDSPIILQRIHLWLQSCLEDQYNAAVQGVVESHYLSDILEGLLTHTQYTKVGPESVTHASHILTIFRNFYLWCKDFSKSTYRFGMGCTM